MDIAFRHPAPRLALLCPVITFYRGYAPPHARERLIPDGTINLVIDLTAREKRLYDGPDSAAGRDFRRAWISGLHRKSLIIEAQQQSSMLIFNLAPAALRLLTGHDGAALADRVETLDAVIGEARSIRDRILEAPTVEQKLDAAEAWLGERLAPGTAPPPATAPMLARLRGASPPTVAALAEETGFSTRQVLNLFHRWVGMGPKEYQRLCRFQRLLLALAPGRGLSPADLALEGPGMDEPDWAHLAASLGYADQPHLAHEFRNFAGITPGEYFAGFRGLTNYLPIGVASR